MSKSEEFLKTLQDSISFEYLTTNGEGIDEIIVDTDKVIHLGNIIELIKQNRFEDLKSYINDDYANTPNKNYTYSLRDKISSEIRHHINYITEIETE